MKSEREHGPLGRKLSAVIALTNAEIAALEVINSSISTFAEGSVFVQEGEPYGHTYVVQEGWAIRFKVLSDGRRQVLNFVLPGDFIGLFSSLFQTADHSVAALTDVQISRVDPLTFVDMFARCPRLAAAVAWSAGRDEAILSEQVVRVGRRSAYERTGHLMIELLHRLRLVGEAERRSFDLPLTQEILADTLGLSLVHINRTLRRLREAELLRVVGNRVVIDDLERLEQVAEFSPEYLQPEPLPKTTQAALPAL